MKKVLLLILLIMTPFFVFAYPYGDVDGSNKVDIRDYGLIMGHITGNKKLVGDELKRADIDGKDGINSRDLGLTLQAALGKDISSYIDNNTSSSNKCCCVTKELKYCAWRNGTSCPSDQPFEDKNSTQCGTMPTITPSTPTPTPLPKIQRTISFVGGDIVSTGYEGNEVLIEGGKVSEHSSYKKYIKNLGLKVNQKYVLSFDYQTKSGTNKFDVDLYPDSLPQINLTATTTRQHYDWAFSSSDSQISGGNTTLRFFDDIRDSSESDIMINNILLSKVATKTYTNGDTLGSLPTPSRKGYKFLGWYTSGSGGTQVTSSTIVTSDMTLYARWGGLYDHVFIIGIDGLGDTYRTDKQKSEPYNKVNAVNFRRIFGDYAYRYDAKTENVTISAQNWTSIFTGVTCENHGITNNIASSKERSSNSKYLTIFNSVRRQMPNARMTSIVNWNPINYGIIEKDIGVEKIHKDDDNQVTSEVVSYINNNKSNIPTLMFVHLCDVDHAAHNNVKSKVPKCGSRCGGYSDAYYNQAQVSDTQLGQMFDAINNLGLMNNSLFITVADHGESATSHGTKQSAKRDPEEEHVVVAVRGYTVNKMTLPKTTQNRDVSAIVLYALGIDRPESSVASIPSGLFNR